MPDSPLATAHRHLGTALDELTAATDHATDTDLLSVLTLCEGLTRRLDQLTVTAVATLQRRGTFAERGYRSTAAALGDLLGWERFEARRHLTAAEQVCPRVGLDGTPLPAHLPATADVFAAAAASLRHVEAIARVLGSPAAQRLTPETWADAETQLAAKSQEYTPSELRSWGEALIELLDQDGAEPDDHPPAQVNELHLTRHHNGAGGRITGHFDDAAMFDAIATVIDAGSTPRTAADDRPVAQRQAEALADACGYVLDHADLPQSGGRRPHLNVLIRLDDLQNRARAAMLDLGGTLTPETLRMLACDAGVVPIVMNGHGQPLDVGRLTRTIPDGIRRAVTARDRGCAHCGRPPSWCDIHHIRAWEHGGGTSVGNCVMLCRACHRLVHHSAWDVRIRDGLPELIPPAWIDPRRQPRRRPLPHLLGVA